MRALRLSIGGRRWLAPAGGVYIAAVLSTNYYTFIQGVRRPRAGQRREGKRAGPSGSECSFGAHSGHIDGGPCYKRSRYAQSQVPGPRYAQAPGLAGMPGHVFHSPVIRRCDR